MVAINPSKTLDPADIDLFEEIVKRSPNIPDFEHTLIQSASKNNESLLRWKYIYEQHEDRYRTFISTVENVCRSLCSQHQIKKAVVSSRLKTFERFSYEDAILDPDELKDLVFKGIRDIAGVRIICVFNDEVLKLEKLFQSGLEPTDLECSDIKRYTQNRKDKDDLAFDPTEYNYRAFHVTVKPGKERKKLIEYKNIDSVQCEIQIRTYFAHGWSDVEHPMVYKDKLYLEVIDDEFRNDIKRQLGEISQSLKAYDEQIATLKEKRDNYKFPIIE
jgi:ppGpp synthetase/RelA/SpoT-type nucleotidyltranferase